MLIRRERLPQWLLGAGSIALAMALMNVGTYGFTMIAARMLGPGSYSAFASLMAALLVLSVVQLGLQTTAARRISADPPHTRAIEHSILRVTTGAALALGLLCAALAPFVSRLLRLDNVVPALILAVAVVPLTIMGGQAGVLQGERRWRPLALVYLANGLPRLALGAALLLWQPNETTAMVAVALGQFVPVLIGGWVLRSGPVPTEAGAPSTATLVRETLHNSQALLAFLALSNVDVIVARNVLDPHDAGLYAAGLILAKAVLFLPQFVVVLAFPAMSTAHERRAALTRSLGLVGALGLVATVGSVALSGVAMVFVGGSDYAEIESKLWLFALLGTIMSMLQLLVYSVLARRGQRSIHLVWAALIALVALGSQCDSLESLLTVAIVVEGSLLAVLAALSMYLVSRPLDQNVPGDHSAPQ